MPIPIERQYTIEIEQTAVYVEQYTRRGSDTGTECSRSDHRDLVARAELPSVAVHLPLGDIYAGLNIR